MLYHSFSAFLSCLFFCFLFAVHAVINPINNQSWVSDTQWKSSLCRCSCFRWGLHYSRLTGVPCADGTFKEIVTGKVSESSFLSNSDCEESVLLNEDSCFNVPSIPPSGQIYPRLRELRIYPSSPFCWPGTCVYVVLWLLIYILTACICVFCWCVFFLFVYTCTPLVVCVRAFFSAYVCVCIANRSYWLVVKPRSLRVFMSGEAEQLGGIFLSLKQNDSLDSPSPLWQPLLSKETHFPESTVLPPIF